MIKIPLTLGILLISVFPVLLFILYVTLATYKLRNFSKAWYALFIVEVLVVYGVPTLLNFLPMKNGIGTSLYGDYYNFMVRATQIIRDAKLPLDVAYCPVTIQNYPLNASILIATVALFSGCDIFMSTKVLALTMFFLSMLSVLFFSKLFFPKNRFVFSFLLSLFVLFGGNLFWLRLIPTYATILFTKGLSANLASPYWALHFRHDPGGHLGPTWFLFGLNKAFCIPLIFLGIGIFLEGVHKEDFRRPLVSGILGTFILGSHPYAFMAYILGIWASLFFPSKRPALRSIDLSSRFALISTLVSISTITYWIRFFPHTMSVLHLYKDDMKYTFALTIWNSQPIHIGIAARAVASILFQYLERWGIYFSLLTLGMLKMRRSKEHYWLLVWLTALSLFYAVDPTRLKEYTLCFASLPLYFMSSIVLTEASTKAYKKVGYKRSIHNSSLILSSALRSKTMLLILLILFSSIANSLFLLPMYTATSLIAFHSWTEVRSAYWLNRYSPRTVIVLEPDFSTGQTIIPIFALRRVLVGPWDQLYGVRAHVHLKHKVYEGISPWAYYDELARYNVDYIFIQSSHRKALDEILVFPKFNLIYNNHEVMYLKV